jgi:hypothetical protein
MSNQSELPEYLAKSNKVIYWDIQDPDGRDYAYHKLMRNRIDGYVRKFINDLD